MTSTTTTVATATATVVATPTEILAASELIDSAGLLDDTELEIQRVVRAFADESLRPGILDWFEQGTLPRELAREFGRLGLVGAENVIRTHWPGLSSAWSRRRRWSVALSFLYIGFVRILQLVRLSRHGQEALAIEVIMLRHEVAVLRRQVARPALLPVD